jgi:hypothetical protein
MTTSAARKNEKNLFTRVKRAQGLPGCQAGIAVASGGAGVSRFCENVSGHSPAWGRSGQAAHAPCLAQNGDAPRGAGNIGPSQTPAMARTFSRVAIRQKSLARRAKIPQPLRVFPRQFAFHMSEGLFSLHQPC